MTEREAQMIAAYIPNPPDPTLEFGEYYFLQNKSGTERVIRVFALDCYPHKDGTAYGCYRQVGGRLVHVDDGWDSGPYHGIYLHQLYDNKEDCRNQTHSWFERWEDLRRLQQEEARA